MGNIYKGEVNVARKDIEFEIELRKNQIKKIKMNQEKMTYLIGEINGLREAIDIIKLAYGQRVEY